MCEDDQISNSSRTESRKTPQQIFKQNEGSKNQSESTNMIKGNKTNPTIYSQPVQNNYEYCLFSTDHVHQHARPQHVEPRL